MMKRKAFLCILLSVVITITMIPSAVFADGNGVNDPVQNELSVSVEHNNKTEDSFVLVDYNTTTSLTANVTGGSGNYSYQWYKCEYDRSQETYNEEQKIDGATNSTFTTENITDYINYYCVVADGDKSKKSEIVKIKPESKLREPEDGDYNIKVEPDETTISLNVNKFKGLNEVIEGVQLSYQWYKYNENYKENDYWEPIEGANSNTYNPPIKTAEYKCVISDLWSRSVNLYYFVRINNNCYIDDYSENIVVKKGGNATIEVKANVKKGGLSYKWYIDDVLSNQKEEIEDGESYSGATTKDLQLKNITASHSYRCVITDEYGNEDEAQIKVYVDSGLEVKSNGPDINVLPGIGAKLVVSAVSDNNVTYRWQKEVNDEYQDIEGEVKHTYNVSHLNDGIDYERYRCIVQDGINTEVAYFDVNINTGISTDSDSEIEVEAGKTAKLHVDASSKLEGNKLNYQWYISDDEEDELFKLSDNEQYSGSNTDTLTVKNVNHNCCYVCKVTDKYGCSSNEYIDLYVKNELKLEYDSAEEQQRSSDVELTVDNNGNINSQTLKFKVTAKDLTDIKYVWSKFDENDYEYNTVSTGKDHAVSTPGEYRIEVEDKYGNKESLYYYVSVNSGLKLTRYIDDTEASDEEDTARDVNYGEFIKLKVLANKDSGVTYSWYQVYDGDDDGYHYPIEAEAQQPNIIKYPASRNATVVVVANDGYTTKRAYFGISVPDGQEHEFDAFAVDASGKEFDGDLNADLNTEVECRINTKNANGEVEYSWYGLDGSKLASETSNTCKIKVRRSGNIKCKVKDSTGAIATVQFTISVPTDLKLTYPETVKFKENTPVTLSVNATSSSDRGIIYTWYYVDEYGDREILDGEYDNTLYVRKPRSCSYMCVADDGIGTKSAKIKLVKDSESGSDPQTEPSEEDKAAAAAVDLLIKKIPAVIALKDEATVKAASDAYEELTANQKKLISASNFNTLKAAEDKIKSLKKAITDVEALIKKIPATSTIALKDEKTISDARKAYNALTAEQKAKVTNLATLEAAEKKMNQLKADAVKAKINALPTKITLENKATVEDARAAYDALTADQKKLVDTTTLKKLTDAEKIIAEGVKDVDKTISAINQIPTVVTLDNEADVKSARKAYDSLTAEQKKLVSSEELTKLEKAEKTISQWKEYNGKVSAAQKVKIKMNSAKVKGGCKVIIAWSKKKTADGYLVRYSTDKKFKKDVKKATVKNSKTGKVTIKKLKAGKKYYSQIRSFKKIKNKATGETNTIYGKWSKSKSFKAK